MRKDLNQFIISGSKKAIALFALIGLFSLSNLAGSLEASGLIVLTHEVDQTGKRRPVHPWWHWHHPPHHHHPPVIIVPPQPRPRPVPQRVLPLSIRKHSVRTEITGQIAVTTIEQVFYNPNQRRLEGEFWLPLNPGVHLDKFSMNVNGHMQEAELLDAVKARKIYEDIVRKQKDPALLEFDGRGLLKCRIFPIEPRSTQRIELVLTQVLSRQQSLIEYNLPLSALKYGGKTIGELSLDIRVDNPGTIGNIYSPSHQMKITRPSDKAARLSYKQKNASPESDFKLFIGIQADSENSPLVGLDFLAQPEVSIGQNQNNSGHFLLLGSPIKDSRKDQRYVPKDVVFVLDTSGSMAKDGKLEQAKNAMEFCLRNLHAKDRFELIRFSTEAEGLYGELTQASKNNVDQAIGFVNQLRPIGGTAIHDALSNALKLRVNDGNDTSEDRPFVVIFLTDGKPTIGETNEHKIVHRVSQLRVVYHKHLDKMRSTAGPSPAGAPSWQDKINQSHQNGLSRVFCFGIGTKINTRLLDRISEDAGGYSQYVLPKEDIEVAVSNFYNRIKNPLLTNLTLTVRSKGANIRMSDFYPRQLPDLYEGDQLQLLGKYLGSGKVELILTGHSPDGKQTFSCQVDLPKSNQDERRLADDDFIAGLWATRRVGFLLDQVRLNGENEELKKEIIRLARAYGIVTPYTAYLIVEDEARRAVPVARRNFQQLEREEWRGVLRENAAAYDKAVSGETAVDNAQFARSLRDSNFDSKNKLMRLKKANASTTSPGSANSPSSQQALQSYTMGYGKAGEKARAKTDRARKDEANVVSRRLRGRTFYQNGKTWVDSLCQQNSKLKVNRIAFASDAYFKLMKDHPEVKQWLSLGNEVQFVHKGNIYEVYEVKN